MQLPFEMTPYRKLAATVGIHFFIMFALTYAGVNELDDIFLNLNRFSMAVIMVAPMVILMVAFMWTMFESPRLNVALLVVSALVFLGGFWAIRSQAFVGDRHCCGR